MKGEMADKNPCKKSCPEAGAGSGGALLGGGGRRAHHAANAGAELEAKIQRAVEFKAEGHRCYKQKKLREAIGKYHRALLQLKGLEGAAEGGGGAAAAMVEKSLLGRTGCWPRLTEGQQALVESTEIECYDSLTGEEDGAGQSASAAPAPAGLPASPVAPAPSLKARPTRRRQPRSRV